ncbi:hypothetical protein [Streptomyces nigrescens]
MAVAVAYAQVTGVTQAVNVLDAGSLPLARRTDGRLAPAARLRTPLARRAAPAADRLHATRPHATRLHATRPRPLVAAR